MPEFREELRDKAEAYRARHGANIVPEGAVYIGREPAEIPARNPAHKSV
jgi:hypothetical protein